MKDVKKILQCLIATAIIGTSCSPMLAQAAVKDEASKNSNIVDVTKDSQNVKISDRLTYDQIVKEYAKDNDVSIKEAKKAIGANDITKARGEFYRTYESTIRVNSYYQPKLKFYCKTSEWDNYIGIKEVKNSSLNRKYMGLTKQFQGTVYTNLENAYTIYYEVNGDFYDNGTTSTTDGASIQVGEGVKWTYNASNTYASNHFAYCNESDRFKLYRD